MRTYDAFMSEPFIDSARIDSVAVVVFDSLL